MAGKKTNNAIASVCRHSSLNQACIYSKAKQTLPRKLFQRRIALSPLDIVNVVDKLGDPRVALNAVSRQLLADRPASQAESSQKGLGRDICKCLRPRSQDSKRGQGASEANCLLETRRA